MSGGSWYEVVKTQKGAFDLVSLQYCALLIASTRLGTFQIFIETDIIGL
jgi:hypothetical protein